jgi:hypothetical protein
MKTKSFTYFLIFIACMLKSQVSFGFLSDPIGVDMYKDIDK